MILNVEFHSYLQPKIPFYRSAYVAANISYHFGLMYDRPQKYKAYGITLKICAKPSFLYHYRKESYHYEKYQKILCLFSMLHL